jgi:hypothetical protein
MSIFVRNDVSLSFFFFLRYTKWWIECLYWSLYVIRIIWKKWKVKSSRRDKKNSLVLGERWKKRNFIFFLLNFVFIFEKSASSSPPGSLRAQLLRYHLQFIAISTTITSARDERGRKEREILSTKVFRLYLDDDNIVNRWIEDEHFFCRGIIYGRTAMGGMTFSIFFILFVNILKIPSQFF